jgi:putative acetyltransferase
MKESRIGPAVDHIRAEEPRDSLAINEVVRQAFGREDEVELVSALRAGGFNLLSLVAEHDGRIVGHLLFTRLFIVGEPQKWNAVALAPLAVLPELQVRGIGSALMREGLRQLADRGETMVVVLGHEHYYPRFGFSSELARPLLAPFSGPSWMALELQPGALTNVSGQAKYAAPFGI